MNVNDIYVSACRGAFDRNTYDVRLVDWLENVRPEQPRNDWEKKQLPAIMPHGLFATRRQDSFTKHSGLVHIDIDGKHQDVGFDVDKVIEGISWYPSAVAVGKSCGGNGLYALMAVEGINENNYHKLAQSIIDEIELGEEVTCDLPVSMNLSGLRFASPYMPYINLDAIPHKP